MRLPWLLVVAMACTPAPALEAGRPIAFLEVRPPPDAGRPPGVSRPDAAAGVCDEHFSHRTLCPEPCDDGDPCTEDTCSAMTSFHCLSTPRCPGAMCVNGQCVTEVCSPSREAFGPCAFEDGQVCTVLQPDGSKASTSRPGRARAECADDEECTPEGVSCLPAPDRALVVEPLDAGHLLGDGGLSVPVAVMGVRNGADTAFQLRLMTMALQRAGWRPPTRLTFPAGFTWTPGWSYVVTREGAAVRDVEALARPEWLCELFECQGPRPFPRRTTPAGVWTRQRAAAELKLGRTQPRYEASGDFVVHVYTVFEGEPPAWSLGATLATLAPGCDPAVDALRTRWNQWANEWTDGGLSLGFSFVDHGVIRLPDDDVLRRLGKPTVPRDDFRNSEAIFGLAALQRPNRGPKELILVAFVAADGDGGGGTASPDRGIALVSVPRDRSRFRAGVTLHELGHLFGAVDLYSSASATGCAPSAGDEFTPDLYCWSSGISRLNARELGWLLPDGGPAAAVTRTCQSPTSGFGCDPD
ncbi:MAG: hypothetical protein SFW67_05810 [Myxococcaceae bacterium]|nr:hypothetical protein [Myxococcaceae bacterium]